MPEEMTCFACEQEPTQQCPRCGRPYCDDHGEDVCDACLEPASALPSFTLYRGSLLALLIGTFLAVWLILQPPGDSADSAVSPQVVTPTEPAVVQTTPTAPAGTTGGTGAATTETPIVQETPLPTSTQAPGAGATETPPPASGTTTYTVQSGDSLFAICSNLSSLDPAECVEQALELNSITDPGAISVGETLTIPQ
jgi:LysM repeat protein